MLNRGQMRLEVRRAVGELTESTSLYTDAELNDWLNEAAVVMTSIAQPFESFFSFTCSLQPGSSSAYLAEYPLPETVDEIFAVSYSDGGRQVPLKRADNITGIRIEGQPSHFYTRYLSKQTAELRDTGIVVQPIKPDGKARMVLGIYPAPSSAYVMTVSYYARHFAMDSDFEVPIIPPEYRRGLIKYVEALAREKDDDVDLANVCRTHFGNFADQLKSRVANQGQEVELPCATIVDDDVFDGYQVHWSTD